MSANKTAGYIVSQAVFSKQQHVRLSIDNKNYEWTDFNSRRYLYNQPIMYHLLEI